MPEPARVLASSRVAAWLLVAVAVLSVVGGLLPAYPDWMTGAIGWLACALFWPRLQPTQRRVTLALIAVGVAGIAWGALRGRAGLVTLALTQNMPLIGMLIAVSFLQLVSTQRTAADESLTTGRYALLRTLIGVHLFGAVINFSAVMIFADRMSARVRLSVDQATGLSQAFIIGSIWSPFYGAMAVALTFAPAASVTRLVSVGLPLGVAAILITWLTLSSRRHGYARDFAGYPLHLEALTVPFVLAVSVLLLHEFRPAWPVLTIIALMAPTVTVITLLLREGNRTGAALLRLIEVRLPEMGGEMALFMAAGLLSAGMTGIIAALDLGVPFTRFGAFEASLTTLVVTLAAWSGFHPVILGMVVAPWIVPLNPDPNLLALSVILPWAIGLPGCPLSNTVLALHARYGVSSAELLRRNRLFGMQMLVLCVAALYAYEWVWGARVSAQ